MSSKNTKPNRMSLALQSDPLAATIETQPVVEPPTFKEPAAVHRTHVALPEEVASPVVEAAVTVAPEQAVATGRRITRSSELGEPGYKAGGRRPATDLLDVAPVRLTAYLTPAQVKLLRKEVARRQAKGKRSDLSMLIREAIDAKFAPEAK